MVPKQTSRVRTIDKAYVKEQEHALLLQRRKRRGLFRRLTVLAIIAIIFGGISFGTIYAQTSLLEAKRDEKVMLQDQLEQLQHEEKRLYQDIQNYNDLDYIADIARRDYYLSKPGETLFKLPTQTPE